MHDVAAPYRVFSPPGSRPPHEALPDEELVARARSGDRGAFRQIVERHQDRVTFTVVSMLGRGEEVDDVVQEVFISCYQSLDRFRGDAAIGTYLKKIAVNRSLDALRRRKRWMARFVSRDDDRRPLQEPAGESRPALESDERAALVHRAIAALPDKQKAVVVLRLIEGYSTEETADMLQIAYGTVLSRLSRATDTLKETLRPLLGETV